LVQILDCESRQSMFESLEQITGISEGVLLTFFDEFDLDEYYEERDPEYTVEADDLFVEMLKKMSPRKNFQFDGTAWFHLTRTYPGNDFSEGILPTHKVIDKLFDYLYTLQKKLNQEEWNRFRLSFSQSGNEYAYLYNLKLSKKSLCGPYAMLIKEVAFCPHDIGNHDYLKIPEIVEDICMVYQEQFGEDLAEKFISSTKPCIVKFINDSVDEYYLGVVMNYLYHVHKGLKISLNCNTSYDAKGELIPNKNIVKIEFLNMKYDK